MSVLCCIWFIVAFLWITITSALDKEWMIDGRGINNVCDVLMYLEDDDTRDVGVIMTLPLFPFSLVRFVAKKTRLVYVRHRAGYFRLLVVAVFFCAISFACEPDGFIRPQRPYKLPA